MALHFPLFFILYFVRVGTTYRVEITAILCLSLIFLTVMFYRTRYFEIDYSGEVISLRSFHPIFKSIERRTVFPKQKLNDYKVEKDLGGTILKLSLKMLEKKTTIIKYSVQGFSKNKIQKLEKSLLETKREYEAAI